VRRATPQEVAYPTGYFSEPVRLWPGLCDYKPTLHVELRQHGISSEQASAAREVRETNKHYHGSPCIACRATLRYVKNGVCVACKALNNAGQRRKKAAPTLTFMGADCNSGHGGLRYESSRRCVQCSTERSAEARTQRKAKA
jgi:hypothetical protein